MLGETDLPVSQTCHTRMRFWGLQCTMFHYRLVIWELVERYSVGSQIFRRNTTLH